MLLMIRFVALAVVVQFGLADGALSQPLPPFPTTPGLWAVIHQAERAVSDRERAGLRGPVLKVTEGRVSGPVALLIRGTPRITTKVVEYDDRGTEVFREDYREWNGDLMRTLQRRHDDAGRVAEITEELWGVIRPPDFFGHIGRSIETPELQEALMQDFDGPTQTIRKRFRYEGDRLADVEINDTAVGAEADRRVYEYEPAGRQIRVYSSNDHGDFTPASVSEYRQQPDGTIERVTTYSLYGTDRARYDSAGRLLDESISAGRAGPPRYALRYDPAGREVERIDYDRTGAIQTRRTQTYDVNGHLTEMTSWSAERDLVRWRYAYRYDEQGNWITRTATSFDQEVDVHPRTETVERTITYAPIGSRKTHPQTAESGHPE